MCHRCPLVTNGTDRVVEVVDLDCDQDNIINPAGAVFAATLASLNELERHFLLFSAGSNLVAVRWLLILGADKDARDLNGSSCLHTACRTGSLPVILELLEHGIGFAGDCAGWTPLHIAVFMCRRDVVHCLLKANASLQERNLKGQTPLDLCTDPKTREFIVSFLSHKADKQEHDIGSTMFEYEPFFVPRRPVINDFKFRQEFMQLGVNIFNRQAGRGLAFLVAAGCTRGCPSDVSALMRCGKLDPAQVGNFLGESFSLSAMIRLEFVNSVRFQNTGVVSSLARVFDELQVPSDLQKIDRLVHSVARMWWRQHEKGDDEGSEVGAGIEMYESHSLKQYISGPETLYQLMFSAMMLHGSLHSHFGNHHLSLPEWIELNRGLEAAQSDVPVQILESTYHTIQNTFIPQFAIQRSTDSEDSSELLWCFTSELDPDSADGQVDEEHEEKEESPTTEMSTVEGWVRIANDIFTKGFVGGHSGVESCRISSIFSESCAGRSKDPFAVNGMTRRRTDETEQALMHSHMLWLSLCKSLLLFSSSPSATESPHAFIHLGQVVVENSPDEPTKLTLVGHPGGRADAKVGCGCVLLVLLLPDGRWQEIELPRLDIEVAERAEFERWLFELQTVCTFTV